MAEQRYVLVNNEGVNGYYRFLHSALEESDQVVFNLAPHKDLTVTGLTKNKDSAVFEEELYKIGRKENGLIIVEENNIDRLREIITEIYSNETHLLSIITDLKGYGEDFVLETDPFRIEADSTIECTEDSKQKIERINSSLEKFETGLVSEEEL